MTVDLFVEVVGRIAIDIEVGTAEIDVQHLRTDDPVLVEGYFAAATDGPSHIGARLRSLPKIAVVPGDASIDRDIAIGQAARAVDEEIIGGKAQPAANSAEPVRPQ